MNLSIDPKRLYALLEQAPPCNPPELAGYQGDISDYLVRHYLMPFLHGGEPCVRDLDFSKFTTEDVRDLEIFLNSVSETGGKLIRMMRVLSDTPPLSLVGQRAFC